MSSRSAPPFAKTLDLTIAIGGAAGQGIATPGNILAKIFARRGLHLYSYNAHQSIIRGGHILLMLRVGETEVLSHGDRLDMLLCLNQDTMDRHLGLLGQGGRVLFNSDDIEPGEPSRGVHLCPMPVKQLTGDSKNKVIQNTLSLGVMMSLLGADFSLLAEALSESLGRKGPAVVEERRPTSRAARVPGPGDRGSRTGPGWMRPIGYGEGRIGP
jgi:2-oxoglutarate ferredoxin oxidoreductase subunit alpha